jgi:hypothetical protein
MKICPVEAEIFHVDKETDIKNMYFLLPSRHNYPYDSKTLKSIMFNCLIEPTQYIL